MKVKFSVLYERWNQHLWYNSTTNYIQRVQILESSMALQKFGAVDDLPLPPIVSNIGVKSYHLAKYLLKLLSPLCKSQYTVESIWKDFIGLPKHRKSHLITN